MPRSAIALAIASLAAASASSAQSADAPPSAPGNVRATLYERAGGELFWQRSTDDRGAVRGYEVTRNGQSLGILDALSFYDPTLEPNTPYAFTVVAIDNAGQRSSVATATLGGATAPASDAPDAPDELSAAIYSRTAAELFWQREPAALALRYEVRRDGRVVATTDGISYYTDALAAGTDYAFEVVAIGRDGRRSAPSTIAVRTDRGSGPATPALPAPAELRAEVYSSTAAELFWTRAATPGLSYEVRRDDRVVGTTDGTSFYDDGLTADTTYRYEVVASGPAGRSDASRVELTTADGGEMLPLPVRDSFTLNTRPEAIEALESVTGFFEEFLTGELPVFVERNVSIPFSREPLVEGLEEDVLIDIDASGTGSYRDVSRVTTSDTVRNESRIATRTDTASSVVWSGTYAFSDSSSGIQQDFEFTTETGSSGAGTLLQSGEFTKTSSGDVNSGNRPFDVTYSLTTAPINGLRECDPLAGTIVYDSVFVVRERELGDVALIDTVTTIDKREGDRYWTVREVGPDGSVFNEYLVASIALGPFCDFAGL